jgi:hypothetical protein
MGSMLEALAIAPSSRLRRRYDVAVILRLRIVRHKLGFLRTASCLITY